MDKTIKKDRILLWGKNYSKPRLAMKYDFLSDEQPFDSILEQMKSIHENHPIIRALVLVFKIRMKSDR